MPGVRETLVDAVVAFIDAATYSQAFTPAKKLVPIFERDVLTGYDVTLYAGPIERVEQSRGGVYLKTYTVGLVVRTTADGNNAQNETKTGEFLQLVEEICNSLQGVKMAGLPLVEIEEDQPFDVGKVSDNGVLMTQVNLRYKGF
jgi:hypothetical protein